jgi:hypothetical protein
MKRWLPLLVLLVGAGLVGSQLARRGGSQGADAKPEKQAGTGSTTAPGVASVWLGWQLDVSDEAHGIKVLKVFEGGPAARAGIVAGDVLKKFQGAPARWEAIKKALATAKEGDAVVFEKETDEGPVAVTLVASSSAGIDALLVHMVPRGVKALVSLQGADGLWPDWESPRPGVAVSALACAALAAVGSSGGEDAARALDRGITALLARRAPDGGLDDVDELISHRVYANACLVLAFPPGKAPPGVVEWITHAQIKGPSELSPAYGGFRYFENDRRADISVSAWALEALDRRIPDDRPEWDRASRFVERTQNLEALVTKDEEPFRDGGFAFNPVLSKAGFRDIGSSAIVHLSYGSATADGVRALVAILKIRDDRTGAARRDVRAEAALRWLATNYAVDRVPGFPATSAWSRGLHLYYLCSLARALHGARVAKLAGHDWPDELARVLAQRQDPNTGSFSTPNGLMGEDSTVVATSLALLALGAARDERFQSGGSQVEAGPAVPPPPIQPWAPGPEDKVERGRIGFQQKYGCMACHVDAGSGQGPRLVGIADGYLEHFRTLEGARDYFKKHIRDPKTFPGILPKIPGKDMPGFGQAVFGDDELDVIVEFLLSRLGEEPVSEARAHRAGPALKRGNSDAGRLLAHDCTKCHAHANSGQLKTFFKSKAFDPTKKDHYFNKGERELTPEEIDDLKAYLQEVLQVSPPK